MVQRAVRICDWSFPDDERRVARSVRSSCRGGGRRHASGRTAASAKAEHRPRLVPGQCGSELAPQCHPSHFLRNRCGRMEILPGPLGACIPSGQTHVKGGHLPFAGAWVSKGQAAHVGPPTVKIISINGQFLCSPPQPRLSFSPSPL